VSDPGPTGNPVFDYRAGFRAFADTLQRWMLLGGAAIFLVAGIVAVVRTERAREISLLACGGGALLFVCGVAWGFYWRRLIRAEFREKFRA
jgi:hypothetical protein